MKKLTIERMLLSSGICKTIIYSFTLLFGCTLMFLVSACTPHVLVKAPVRLLTNDARAIDLWPYFSADGDRILFSRSINGGKTWELFTISLSGGRVERFSQNLPVSATRASWSIKRDLIAFTGTSTDGNNSVWLINADGKEPRQLITQGLSNNVFYPSWYPDGANLAVLDWPDKVIKRIDLNSKIAVTLTDNTQVLTGMPSVSPDGRWIAFAGQKNVGLPYDQTKNSIWLVSNTGELRTLEDPPVQGRTPAWSPDGIWLAFESNRDNAKGFYCVYIIRRDGTDLRRITTPEIKATHPVWSPDGRHLTFSVRHTENNNAVGIAVIDVLLE